MTSDDVGQLLTALLDAALRELLALWAGDTDAPTRTLSVTLRCAAWFVDLLTLILAGRVEDAEQLFAEVIASIQDAVYGAG